MLDEYQASLDFLYGRLNYERVGMPRASSELRLGRMRRLLRRLGDPQDAHRIVHVAGTKGKGSTAAMMAAALTASGVRTGLFCSPHLHRLEERFAIDGELPGPDELVALTEAVRPAVAYLDEHGPHYRQRGPTLSSIATEKAGILKRDCAAVSGVRGDEARAPIHRIARQRRVRLRELDHDFHYVFQRPDPTLKHPAAGRVAVQTWRTDWGLIELPLIGAHQAHNAAVALAGLDVLAEEGLPASRDAVVRGFATLSWPARIEILGESPWLVIDGAHNVASAQALADSLQTCFPPLRKTLVFGTTKDKDLAGQLQVLLPLFDTVIATRYVENPRSVPPEEIAAAIERLDGVCAWVAPDPAEALAAARRLTATEELICVTGSLFLAAETRALILAQDVPGTVRPLMC